MLLNTNTTSFVVDLLYSVKWMSRRVSKSQTIIPTLDHTLTFLSPPHTNTSRPKSTIQRIAMNHSNIFLTLLVLFLSLKHTKSAPIVQFEDIPECTDDFIDKYAHTQHLTSDWDNGQDIFELLEFTEMDGGGCAKIAPGWCLGESRESYRFARPVSRVFLPDRWLRPVCDDGKHEACCPPGAPFDCGKYPSGWLEQKH